MSQLPLLMIYTGMLIFDFAVLAGTAYLIAKHNWSAWWMLLAVFMCAGSNPKRLILAWNGGAA